MKTLEREIPLPDFGEKVLSWLRKKPFACILDGNNYPYPGGPFRKRMACGSRNIHADADWTETIRKKPVDAWWFGYLGYELKNEGQNDSRPVFLNFPSQSFFEAEVVIEWLPGKIRVHSEDPAAILEEIMTMPVLEAEMPDNLSGLISFTDSDSYKKTVESIRELITEGEVYELNYCLFYGLDADPDGLLFFNRLNQKFPMPFSAWYKADHLEIACASPERFLKKEGRQLTSQPIKGTARRGKDPQEDVLLRQGLLNSEKERAENMMIVDLVRNDLAKVSEIGSTRVSELFGIYEFPTVFQMISTIQSAAEEGVGVEEIIASAFPMGSMTGAPKPAAISQIAALETFRRGAYSGALGCIEPENNFDFNVLIRSFFINHHLRRSGFAVGSAITIDSDWQAEWAECRDKAAALVRVCGLDGGM